MLSLAPRKSTDSNSPLNHLALRPLKSGGSDNPLNYLMAILAVAAVGLLGSARSIWRRRSTDGVSEHTTIDTRADAVKAFADGRAATKGDGGVGGGSAGGADGGSAGDGSLALPVAGVLPWIPIQRTRLLIACDYLFVLSYLRETLEGQPDLEVVGEATTAAEAVELTERLHPRVVLIGLHLPQTDSVETIASIKEENPDTNILVIATQDDDAAILPAIEAGATGYVLEDSPREELLEAIRAAAHGTSVSKTT
ncbi:MAG: response regulator transcription factor [Rubrobacter sp.]|nr:response regulator transcription factor [Rubrobacter sp.]